MEALRIKSIIGLPLFYLCCLFISTNSLAQNVSDYFLIPGAESILPVGETMKMFIRWYDNENKIHEGINALDKTKPEWTINGQPSTSQNSVNGKLSVDLGFETATYTAPAKIPARNPVVIAVRFPASDTSKEMVTLLCKVTIVEFGNKWFVSFTYSATSNSLEKSASDERTYSNRIFGSAAMLIKGTPPDKNGHVLISTSEGDSITSYSSSGKWTENFLEISRDINGSIIEKTIRNYEGAPTKDITGIEFEYDPSPGGIKGILDLGLNYSAVGEGVFYGLDDNNHLVLKEDDDGPTITNISLGHHEDILKKISNGFTIDYFDKEDKNYTDDLGMAHQVVLITEYHVTIKRTIKSKLSDE